MVDINFEYKNYKFESIKENDLTILSTWMKKNNNDSSISYSSDEQMLYRRFLEYYVTEGETFVKVSKGNEMIAIFKGRFDSFNYSNKLFIWLFIMEEKCRNEGIGSEIIGAIIDEFSKEYRVNIIEVGVVQKNIEGISFWNSLGFEIKRVSKKFFEDNNNEDSNLVIMSREVG